MIAVDASVLIAQLNENDARHARAEELLLRTTDHRLAASSLTIAEVLVGPALSDALEVARTALNDLEVDEVPLVAGAAESLARLRATLGLKLPDCCVLLAARYVTADAVLTFDDKLAKCAKRLGYRVDISDAEDNPPMGVTPVEPD